MNNLAAREEAVLLTINNLLLANALPSWELNRRMIALFNISNVELGLKLIESKMAMETYLATKAFCLN